MYAYFYHENSDSVFIDHHNRDFGPVLHDIYKIGLCFHFNHRELKKRYKARSRTQKIFKLHKVDIDLTKPELPF